MIFSIEEKRIKRRDYQRHRRKKKEIRVKEREYHKKYYQYTPFLILYLYD